MSSFLFVNYQLAPDAIKFHIILKRKLQHFIENQIKRVNCEEFKLVLWNAYKNRKFKQYTLNNRNFKEYQS